jgi:hypothetical protein
LFIGVRRKWVFQLRREFPKCNNFKELHSNQKHFPLPQGTTVHIIKISEKERGLNAKNNNFRIKEAKL